DDFGDFGVFVALAVDDVTPVAPHRADIEKDRLVLRFCPFERVLAPFMPVNGLVRSRTQVRTGGVFQAVRRVVSQDGSQFMSAGGGPLLDFVARAEVARIERLAAGNAFVLAMIETDRSEERRGGKEGRQKMQPREGREKSE